MAFTRELSFWVRTALAISLIYHGVWNLSPQGADWWTEYQSTSPLIFRYFVGGGEIAAAIAFAANRMVKPAAACLIPIFIGAIATHLGDGFSYKNGGIEVPLVFALLCLGLCFESRKP